MSRAPGNINLAIVGCGRAATNHARTAADCGFNIVVCADPIRARATRLAKQFNAKSVERPKEAIHHSSVDAVLVASPADTHHRHVIDALNAEKAVFCETPLANSTARCRKIAEVATRADMKLFVAQPFQYSRPCLAIQSQLESGAIGTPGSLRTFRGWPMPKRVNKTDREASGGPVYDVLIHDFGWICAAFGAPLSVFCQITPPSKTKPGIHALTTVVLESGLIAQCIGSWAYSRPQCRIELCGTEGVIQFNSLDGPISPQAPESGETDPTLRGQSDSEQWRAFRAWIEDDSTPQIGLFAASHAVSIAEAAVKSARTKRRIIISTIHEENIA